MSARLRIAHVIVQPVLVWDDGEELTPGPGCQPITVPLSALPDLPDKLRADLATQQEQAADGDR